MTISTASMAWPVAAAAAVDPDKVTPGLLGFLVVLGLGLATWVLLRSMNRQLKKIDFDDGSQGQQPSDTPPTPPAAGSPS